MDANVLKAYEALAPIDQTIVDVMVMALNGKDVEIRKWLRVAELERLEKERR